MAAMTGSTALRIAAVLSVLVAVLGIALFDLPNLVLGADDSEAPFAIVIGSFASDVLALVAARLRQAGLPAAKRRGTLLQPVQAMASAGHPLRQTSRPLPLITAAHRRSDLASMIDRTRPSQLVVSL